MTFFKIVYLKTGSHLTEIRAHANLYKSENQLKKKLSCLKNESRNKIVHRNSARTQKEAGNVVHVADYQGKMHFSRWRRRETRKIVIFNVDKPMRRLFFLGDYAWLFNSFACLAFSLNVS